jgi:hypothetical protein
MYGGSEATDECVWNGVANCRDEDGGWEAKCLEGATDACMLSLGLVTNHIDVSVGHVSASVIT